MKKILTLIFINCLVSVSIANIYETHTKQYGEPTFAFEDEDWNYKEYLNDITIVYYKGKTALKIFNNRTFSSKSESPQEEVSKLLNEMYEILASHGFSQITGISDCALILENRVLSNSEYIVDNENKSLKFASRLINYLDIISNQTYRFFINHYLWDANVYKNDELCEKLETFQKLAQQSKLPKAPEIEKVDF